MLLVGRWLGCLVRVCEAFRWWLTRADIVLVLLGCLDRARAGRLTQLYRGRLIHFLTQAICLMGWQRTTVFSVNVGRPRHPHLVAHPAEQLLPRMQQLVAQPHTVRLAVGGNANIGFCDL